MWWIRNVQIHVSIMVWYSFHFHKIKSTFLQSNSLWRPSCLHVKIARKHAAYCSVAQGQIVISLQKVPALNNTFWSGQNYSLSFCGCVYTYTCQVLHCGMTSVHEPNRVVRGEVDRKPLKCFPICQADSADPDSQAPTTHWLIFSPTLS